MKVYMHRKEDGKVNFRHQDKNRFLEVPWKDSGNILSMPTKFRKKKGVSRLRFDFKINKDGSISPYYHADLVLGFGKPNEAF
jgi:hypothetical protein